MSARLWRKLFAPLPKTYRRQPCAVGLARKARWKPRLEALEDRTLLSVFTVTNTLDDRSAGSLRDAVRLANLGNGGDTINFADDLSGKTIRLDWTLGSLTLAKNVTITGEGLVDKPVIDGDFGGGTHNFTVFVLNPGLRVSMSHLTITDARGDVLGGGIRNQGTLTVTDCDFLDNTVAGYSSPRGGGIYNGSGSLTLDHCRFLGNSTASFGFGSALSSDGGPMAIAECLFSGNFNGLGALYTPGTATLVNCIVSNNVGGGIFAYSANLALAVCTIAGNFAGNGGGIAGFGSITLVRCTVAGNRADGNGGGIALSDGRLTLTDCTLTGNSAPNSQGGAIISAGLAEFRNCTVSANTAKGAGALYNDSRMTLTNCTVSGNTSTFFAGGGIVNANLNILTLIGSTVVRNTSPGQAGGIANSSGTLNLKNTIVAENRANSGPDVSGTVASQGYNLIQNTAGATITGTLTGNIYGQNPLLGPLQDNGGPTPTHALLPLSPALDAGDPGLAGTPDQRGVTRAALPEIGAYEVASTVRFRLDVVTSVTAGDDFAVTLRTVDVLGDPVTDYTGTVSLTSTDPQAPALGNHTFTAADEGQFTFRGVTLLTAGRQTLVAGDGIVARTAPVQVDPAAVDSFRIGAPDGATAGSPFTVTVSAQDRFGNTTTGYIGTVRVTSSDDRADLPPDYAFTPADQGSHPFRVTLRTACAQSLTATDTGSSTVTGTRSIAVDPAAAASFVVGGFPSPTAAGQTGTFTVQVEDAFGNTVAGYTGRVHFGSTDPRATLPADYTFSAADQGTHAFDAVLRTAGRQSIAANDVASPAVRGTQANIEVTVAAVSALSIGGISDPLRAGDVTTFTVTVQDAFGNAAPDYRGQIHFSSSDPRAILPRDYTFTADDQGTHVFGLVLRTAGAQSLTAADTDDDTIRGTRENIVVRPAAASVFVFTAFPSTVSAGDVNTFIVTVQDRFGNAVTDYTGRVHFSSSDDQAILPNDYTFTAADHGTHVFAAVFFTVGPQTVHVADTLNPRLAGDMEFEVVE